MKDREEADVTSYSTEHDTRMGTIWNYYCSRCDIWAGECISFEQVPAADFLCHECYDNDDAEFVIDYQI